MNVIVQWEENWYKMRTDLGGDAGVPQRKSENASATGQDWRRIPGSHATNHVEQSLRRRRKRTSAGGPGVQGRGEDVPARDTAPRAQVGALPRGVDTQGSVMDMLEVCRRRTHGCRLPDDVVCGSQLHQGQDVGVWTVGNIKKWCPKECGRSS